MTFTVVYQIHTGTVGKPQDPGERRDESAVQWSAPAVKRRYSDLRCGCRNEFLLLRGADLNSTLPYFLPIYSPFVFSRVPSPLPPSLCPRPGHMSIPISGPCSGFNFSRSVAEEWLRTVADGRRESEREKERGGLGAVIFRKCWRHRNMRGRREHRRSPSDGTLTGSNTLATLSFQNKTVFVVYVVWLS